MIKIKPFDASLLNNTDFYKAVSSDERTDEDALKLYYAYNKKCPKSIDLALKDNLIIVGPSGSGKTTLLKTLIANVSINLADKAKIAIASSNKTEFDVFRNHQLLRFHISNSAESTEALLNKVKREIDARLKHMEQRREITFKNNIPRLFFFFDNLPEVDFKKEDNINSLRTIMNKGGICGVHFIATLDQSFSNDFKYLLNHKNAYKIKLPLRSSETIYKLNKEDQTLIGVFNYLPENSREEDYLEKTDYPDYENNLGGMAIMGIIIVGALGFAALPLLIFGVLIWAMATSSSSNSSNKYKSVPISKDNHSSNDRFSNYLYYKNSKEDMVQCEICDRYYPRYEMFETVCGYVCEDCENDTVDYQD